MGGPDQAETEKHHAEQAFRSGTQDQDLRPRDNGSGNAGNEEGSEWQEWPRAGGGHLCRWEEVGTELKAPPEPSANVFQAHQLSTSLELPLWQP